MSEVAKRQKGAGLLQLALGLAVIGVATAGGIGAYGSIMQSHKIESIANDIRNTDKVLRNAFSGRSDYPDLGRYQNEVQFNTLFPESMLAAGGGDNIVRLRHSLGGLLSLEDWSVGCGSCRNAVRIAVYGVSQEECVQLLVKDYGKNVVWVGSHLSKESSRVSPPVSMNKARSLCGTSAAYSTPAVWFKK